MRLIKATARGYRDANRQNAAPSGWQQVSP